MAPRGIGPGAFEGRGRDPGRVKRKLSDGKAQGQAMAMAMACLASGSSPGTWNHVGGVHEAKRSNRALVPRRLPRPYTRREALPVQTRIDPPFDRRSTSDRKGIRTEEKEGCPYSGALGVKSGEEPHRQVQWSKRMDGWCRIDAHGRRRWRGPIRGKPSIETRRSSGPGGTQRASLSGTEPMSPGSAQDNTRPAFSTSVQTGLNPSRCCGTFHGNPKPRRKPPALCLRCIHAVLPWFECGTSNQGHVQTDLTRNIDADRSVTQNDDHPFFHEQALLLHMLKANPCVHLPRQVPRRGCRGCLKALHGTFGACGQVLGPFNSRMFCIAYAKRDF
eukprot:scaffold271_cov336-Pavlova_lutheri.AAC.5